MISNENMIVFVHLTVFTLIYTNFIFKTAVYWDVPNLGTLTLYKNCKLQFVAGHEIPTYMNNHR